MYLHKQNRSALCSGMIAIFLCVYDTDRQAIPMRIRYLQWLLAAIVPIRSITYVVKNIVLYFTVHNQQLIILMAYAWSNMLVFRTK